MQILTHNKKLSTMLISDGENRDATVKKNPLAQITLLEIE